MTKQHQEHMTPNDQHGSVRSYVIGFLLSLVLTIIPYFMVRWQTSTGSTLLLAILGFAIIQMIVQIVFFLHLGRGPKPLYNVVFFAATASMIVLVVGASIIIMRNLNHNMSPDEMTLHLAQDENIASVSGKTTGACQGNKDNHVVIIIRNVASPGVVMAQRCDTLTLKNEDADIRTFSFYGKQGEAASYGGTNELSIPSGKSETITLNETGIFSFRDPMSPATAGTFTVEP